MMNKLFVVIFLFGLCRYSLATEGVDMSGGLCDDMTLSEWQCLVSSGYKFAVVQVWQGGYMYTSKIAQCVSQAWQAGMQHVDVYAFMCPNCQGNNPPQNAISTMVDNLRSQKVNFGMLWIDVEQCSGCWSADLSVNCQYVANAAHAATNMGVNVGIYSSLYEWEQTVGSGCTSVSNYPLWYAHYDGNPSFSDTAEYHFGGWTKPAIKQYDDHGPCTSVDVNWYPD